MASKSKPSLKPGSSNQRLQPIRATRPFQLRQGSPARKSPSSSPTSMVPRSASDPRRNKWQTDHRTSPDRAERRSPSSPSIKVMNRRSPSPRVCRNSSMDSVPALTGTYLTGQWPREVPQNTAPTALIVTNYGTSSNKSTQTPDWNSDFSVQQSKGSKSLPSRSSVIPEEVKQMKQQMRRIAKRQEKKERQSPVHGNHSALPQSQSSQTRSMSNPIPIFGRTPKRQNSLESLNKEIENIIIRDPNEGTFRFPLQGLTPPDGHRAPIMRSSTRTMETQTSGLVQDGSIANGGSHSPSPSFDQQAPSGPHTLKVSETGLSPGPKYASSPRPNNSYMFQREPPEGAESVKPFKEQDIQYPIGSSCPDKQKVHFHPSSNGSFSKFQKFATEEQNNNNGPGACLVNGNAGNCSTQMADPVVTRNFDFQERSSGAGSDSQDLSTTSLMA